MTHLCKHNVSIIVIITGTSAVLWQFDILHLLLMMYRIFYVNERKKCTKLNQDPFAIHERQINNLNKICSDKNRWMHIKGSANSSLIIKKSNDALGIIKRVVYSHRAYPHLADVTTLPRNYYVT